MTRFRFPRSLLVAAGACALLVGIVSVQAQQYDDSPQSSAPAQTSDNSDPVPGRVARLAYLSGSVQFAPAGESDWGSVEVNRPMVIGDRLLTGGDGRAVLELGDASIRIDNDSAFDFLNLDQGTVQVELSQGTLNLAVRQLAQGENFEVDTPTVAFVASTAGIYRIDDDPSGTGSMVTVFQGSGTVYGENGVSRQVAAGTSYRFNDSTLANVDTNGLPQSDDFDRFCEARDANYNRYAQQQQQYVPPDMIGSDDLGQYGQWNNVPEYGNVWYPTSVPAGWAPYSHGHWAWIDPWGWTWVGDEPWGFAPFHYGRWVYARNRWGWMPGQVHVRPVYAPALVAFVGSGLSVAVNLGGGGPVGWFPLGPRDVYVPWFHASRRYFTNVNVTNIRNVYVNKTVINNFYGDYHAGRAPPRGGHDYAYRRMQGAVTAVPRNVFTGARPVHPAALKLNRNQLERSEVALRPGVNPGRSSLGLRNPTARPTTLNGGREPFARPVVARHQPPPRPVGFAAQQKVIASQHGQPLTATQMQNLRKSRPAPANDRVKLVPAVAGAAAGAAAISALHRTPPRPAEPAARTQPTRSVVTPHPAEPVRRAGPTEPFKNTVHPIQAPVNPVRNASPRPGELPSARFAHPREPATLPRAPVIRPAGESQRNAPASGRLPVARPVERAPQRVDNRAVQQQRQAEAQAQQRSREQQAQQQRQAQTQAQQRARDQQGQQQRQQQMQTQQRVRAQQQRQAQAQGQQRANEQQMQQQRQMQQQQRNVQMQRQQQVQQREVQRAPQPRGRPAPQRREPPPKKHPPESSGNPVR